MRPFGWFPAGRRVAIALVLVATSGLVACGGDDDDDEPQAQPSPGGTGFVEGRFDELPLPPRADALGPRREKDGVLSRSWSVRNTTPEEVLDYYEQTLEQEWRVSTPVRRLGQTYRGEWRSDEDELRVSAVPAPAADVEQLPDPSEPLVQLSLQLAPAG